MKLAADSEIENAANFMIDGDSGDARGTARGGKAHACGLR